MWTRGLFAFAALALTSCAHEPIRDPQSPIVAATARAMIASLAPEQSPQTGFQWGAFGARVAQHVRWDAGTPEPIDRPPDAIIHRAGWIEAGGMRVDVSAQGPEDRIAALVVEHPELFFWIALLDALREQGADVRFAADYETYSEYIVSMPGRESAYLTMATSCAPFEPRPAQGCTHTLTLAYELP